MIILIVTPQVPLHSTLLFVFLFVILRQGLYHPESARAMGAEDGTGRMVRVPCCWGQSEVPEALLDAPKVEGLSASGKGISFRPQLLSTQALGLFSLGLPTECLPNCRAICARWGKMFVVPLSHCCSCQPYPQSSPSSSKQQLCPERQKLPVIIRIVGFPPKGTGNVFLMAIAESLFM